MENINHLLVFELRRRLLEEGIPRIQKCLSYLDETQIHYSPNSHCNSVNNLILHLDGNVRQWLISSFTGTPDERKRNDEFNPNNKKTKQELKNIIEKLGYDIRLVAGSLIDEDMTDSKPVQIYIESNLSILIHVIEHFSYHVGQITYITKMLIDGDTGYYADQHL